MKKYVKPDVYYENFEISQSVATNCHVGDISVAGATNFHTKDSCYFDIGTGTTLFDNKPNCDFTPAELDYEDYCYQTGSSPNNFFAS